MPLKVPYFEKHCLLNKKEPPEGLHLLKKSLMENFIFCEVRLTPKYLIIVGDSSTNSCHKIPVASQSLINTI